MRGRVRRAMQQQLETDRSALEELANAHLRWPPRVASPWYYIPSGKSGKFLAISDPTRPWLTLSFYGAIASSRHILKEFARKKAMDGPRTHVLRSLTGLRRATPSRFTCQSRPVWTSRAVSQPPPWQKVSMQMRWPRFRTSPDFCEVWPTTTVRPESVRGGPGPPELGPPELGDRLVPHGKLGVVARVDEDVRLGLVIVPAAPEEGDVPSPGSRRIAAIGRRTRASPGPPTRTSRGGRRRSGRRASTGRGCRGAGPAGIASRGRSGGRGRRACRGPG